MMILITDRTKTDVERWKTLRDKGWNEMSDEERAEWMGLTTPTPSASKGMYTHNDLNRVEAAVKELASRLLEFGYLKEDLDIKTDWMYTDQIWLEDIKRYYGNIGKLRDCIKVYAKTPYTPSTSRKLDYEMANEIEQILSDINDVTNKIPQSWCYAGEIMAMEV